MRHNSTAKILTVILGICSIAVAQAPRRPPGLPDGLQQYPGAPLDVPPEFEFLYQGFIPIGELKATWAALPYESITLERSYPGYKVTLYRGSPSGQGRETYEDRFGSAELHAAVLDRSGNKYAELFPGKNGDFTGRVDIWSYGRLCYLLSKSKFSGLSDRYESGWSDQHTITVTVTASSNTKTVAEYGGVAPIELWGLQEAIDSIAKGINWTAK